MRKLKLLFTCLWIASVTLVSAQTKTASGTVVSAEDGAPVIGASVVVKGNASVGTLTDAEGKYTLTVPGSANTLVISLVGMKSVEVAAAPNQKVSMETNVSELDEVMVVAYGTAKKSGFTGSATSVSGEALAKKNASELSKSLAGEIAGVQVTSGSGQPGSNATIRIRGIGSVNSSRDPLYVVDGIPYSGSISSINPNDIESSTVLKDATATALYGSRGANGVILITTKKGKTNSSSIEIDVKTGINTRWIPLYDVIDSPEQFVELSWESYRNNLVLQGVSQDVASQVTSQLMFGDAEIGTLSPIFSGYNMWDASGVNLIDPTTGKFVAGVNRKYTPENWADHIFRSGQKTDATLRFSGGENNTTYYTSFGLLKDEGYYIASDFTRFNGNVNVDHKFKSWLKGNSNLNYSYTELNNPGQTDDMNNGFQFVNYIPSIYPVFLRDSNGEKVANTLLGGYEYDYGDVYDRDFAFGINPAGALQLDKKKSKRHQVVGNAMLEASFLKDFKFNVNLGVQHAGTTDSELTNKYYGDAAGLGRIEKQEGNLMALTSTQMLSWSKKLNQHSFDAFVAHETNMVEVTYMLGLKSKILKPNSLELGNAVIMDDITSDTYGYSLESYFGQFRYDYDERYFFHATYRRDGSSRFVKDKRWGNFGSLGVAWAAKREDFLRDIDVIKELKLKASYGILGNQSFIGTPSVAGFYPTENLYTVNNIRDQYALYLAYVGNPNLTWENSGMFSTGIEFSLFENSRLSGEIEYFNKTTDNLIFSKQRPTSLGYSSLTVNEGRMNNSGIEASFKVKAIDQNNLKLNIRFNASHYTNKMLLMPLEPATGQPKTLEVQGAYGWSKGHSLYDFYLREWAGVDPSTGQALWNAYYNKKSDGTEELILDMLDYETKYGIEELVVKTTTSYPNSTKKYVGKSAIPQLLGGFGLDIEAYGFELNATLAYSLGGYGYDNIYATLMGNHRIGSNNWHKDVLNRWTAEGTTTNVPRLSNNYSADVYQASASTRFLTKSDYLHLTNVRLAYNFPKRWMDSIKLKTLQLYVTGENLLLLTARNGYVPINSFSGSNNRSDYAPISTLMGGLKVTF